MPRLYAGFVVDVPVHSCRRSRNARSFAALRKTFACKCRGVWDAACRVSTRALSLMSPCIPAGAPCDRRSFAALQSPK